MVANADSQPPLHALRAAQLNAALDQWYRERPWARTSTSATEKGRQMWENRGDRRRGNADGRTSTPTHPEGGSGEYSTTARRT